MVTSGEPPRIPLAELLADSPFANNLVRTTYVKSELHRGFASLSGRESAAVRLAEAVEDRAVDEAAFAAAAAHFDAAELVDLTMLTGFYGLASRPVLALGVPLDDGLSGLESP